MINSIAHQVTLQLIENQMITKEDESVYEYGILLILMTSLTGVCIIFMGCVLKQCFLTLIFLGALIPLRHYAGGYHARSFARCFCISCGSYGVALATVCMQQMIPMKLILIGLSMASSYYLCKVGSVNSQKNPKTQMEMQTRRKRTRFITIGYSCIATLLFRSGSQGVNIATVIVVSQIISAIAVYAVHSKEELK